MTTFYDTLKMSLSTLLTNKLRSCLTMLGIIIGNASIIAISGIGEGARQLTISQLQGLRPNFLYVLPGTLATRRSFSAPPSTLVLADAEALSRIISGVRGIAPEVKRQMLVSHRQFTMSVLLVGTTSEYPHVWNFPVVKGRFLNELDRARRQRVAVIGFYTARRLYKNQNPIGQTIRIQNLSFEIIGVMKEKGSSSGSNNDSIIFVPLETMVSHLIGETSPYGTELSLIGVTVKNTAEIKTTIFQIENLLRLRHSIQNNEDDFSVVSAKKILNVVNTITNSLTFFLVMIASISLIVGNIGVMNIMLISVKERTWEIGLRKALGAKKGDILNQFLIEAVFLSTSGGVIGVVFGVGIVWIVGLTSPLTTVVSPVVIVLSLSTSSSIGLFFGVFPAWHAATLESIVALRNS